MSNSSKLLLATAALVLLLPALVLSQSKSKEDEGKLALPELEMCQKSKTKIFDFIARRWLLIYVKPNLFNASSKVIC